MSDQAQPAELFDVGTMVVAEAFLSSGVSVSEGTVLGACALPSLDPWAMYSGNPAARFEVVAT